MGKKTLQKQTTEEDGRHAIEINLGKIKYISLIKVLNTT